VSASPVHEPELLPVASPREARRALVRLLGPHRALALLAAGVLVARVLVGLVGPAVLGRIVDLVVDGEPASAITSPALLLVAVAVGEGLLAAAGPALVAQVGEGTLATLRERVVDRALHVPLERLERAGTGDLVARVDGDVAVVSEAVKWAIPALIQAALTVGLTVVGLAVLDWRLALAGLCAAPIQLHTLRWYLPRSNPVYAAERLAVGARSQELVETIGGAATIRAFRLAPARTAQLAARSRTAVELVYAAVRLRTRFFARLNLAELVGLTSVLAVGFVLVDRGAVTVGAVTAAALYFQRLFDPINALLGLVDDAQSAGAALVRLVGVAELSPPPEPVRPRQPTDASVLLSAVDFAYRPGHEVLHGIDLCIAPGERVALVGASGAGKSTLAKLVVGIHRPCSGAIRVGGADIDELSPATARRTVVLVTQEVHVFAGTVADDLRLARPGAGDDELADALDRVGAAGWLSDLPDGLATVVGDGGHRLTATQAQQLALARLVLVDPPIAILDEATAEAGSAGARILEAAAGRALAGRTAIVIAHRLTQAASADRVVVLNDGHVVEQGTHAELVAADGSYATLWQAWSTRGAAAV